MKRQELLDFIRSHRYAVQASVSPSNSPQAAVVGIAVTDNLEIIFDTLRNTRKWENLNSNPRIAFVIGREDEQTLQLEGIADEPEGAELTSIRETYFRVFPDGRNRLSWQGITHFRVRPTWLRYSDYRGPAPIVFETTSFAE